MTSRRLPPMIVLAVGAIMSVVAFGRSATTEPMVGEADPISATTVGGSSADAFGSTWFCAAGTVGADGAAEHAVVIVNPGDRDATGSLTIFGLDGILAAQSISVGAQSRSLYRLGDVIGEVEGQMAAMVELDVGAIAVGHQVTGPTGTDHGRCASGAAASWQFAAGVTQQDASLELVLFNPFPETASVDVVFDAEDGYRAPQAFEGLVIPSESIRVLDVDAEVPLREALATRVTVRSGRVVADRVQSFDGTVDRSGLGVELGATGEAVAWGFPAGRVGEGESAGQLIIANVTDTPAEIEVQFIVDEALDGPGVITRTVFPGNQEIIEVDPENRLEPATPLVAVVRSYNGVPVVVEQRVDTTQPLSFFGDTVMASRYVLPSVDERSGNPEVMVFNPADTATTITVGSLVLGELKPRGSFQVGAGSLGVYPLSDGVTMGALLVEADHPVLVGMSGPAVTGSAIPLENLTAIPADF